MLRIGIISILIFISFRGLAQNIGTKIPFQLINNHIYLQGKLNDSMPVWILLDCGAPSLVSEREAKKDKLNTKPLGQSDGVGNEYAPVRMTDSVSFTLGSLKYVEKRMVVIALDEIEKCGAEISVAEDGKIRLLKEKRKKVQQMDAVLGDKFFRRYVIEVDYQKKYLTIFEPSTYHYIGKGDHVPFAYIDNHIYITASVHSNRSIISGRFMVDCGSSTAVILNVPFIRKHQLKPSTDSTEISLCGIGGYSKSTMSRINNLQIGKLSINKPITLFSRASGGVLTNPDVAGSVGNGILRKFKVIYNYSKSELILEKIEPTAIVKSVR